MSVQTSFITLVGYKIDNPTETIVDKLIEDNPDFAWDVIEDFISGNYLYFGSLLSTLHVDDTNNNEDEKKWSIAYINRVADQLREEFSFQGYGEPFLYNFIHIN